jgi:hypothetical protein
MFYKAKENKLKIDEILFSGRNSLLNFQEALKSLMSISSPLTLEIEEKALVLINAIIDQINTSKELFLEDQLIKLNKINSSIDWSLPNLKSRCAIQLSKKYFLMAMESFEVKNYVNSISNCEHSLEFARQGLQYKNGIKQNFIDELNSQLESACFLLIRSKSYLIFEKANDYFDFELFNREQLDFESVKYSLDLIREALLIAKCIEDENKADIELEAIISSKIGEISYKILKDREKAESYVKISVELGMSLFPRNVQMEDWYRKASEILKEIRKTKELEEQKRMREIKEKYYNEVYTHIVDLDEKEKKYSVEKFIKYVLKKHPPRENLNFNVEEEKAKSNMKRVFIKVIAFYHPDKFSSEDMKKKVLMEEITKILNRKYSYFNEFLC